jgi:Cu+-exporting ATPase
MAEQILTAQKLHCYHCGDDCKSDSVSIGEKYFCCEGCRLVYDILNENNLSSYYAINKSPGKSQKKKAYREQFSFLDDEGVKEKLIQFTDGNLTRITFSVPQIHCSSCIWLLEHLSRIHDGVIRSQVNFSKREASITFNEKKISLRKLVEMLSAIGYEPRIQFENLDGKKIKRKDHTSVYKIGIAGFCFGNIMLFSFPEYFSSGVYEEHGFKGMFSYLNLGLSLPVFFYCSSQFFRSAFQSMRQKYLNIDVPIALGILVMFVRSVYEIVSGTGAGFMDTMSGLVFFMLVGRSFQNKTYETISFERDFKSFFPVSVMVRRSGKETTIPVSGLNLKDTIIIRNEELIPADSVLLKGEAMIDYSFVTGEAAPVSKQKGELIYAGGKQMGTVIELEVVKEVSQSYLTQLWNSDSYQSKRDDSRFRQLVNQISHYFTIVLFTIALASLAGWATQNQLSRGWNAFTAVLIIACPCALAISSPFTLGNILRIFGRNNFYLKNYTVIEKLARVNTIVFDKTGTLTKTSASAVHFVGSLNEEEKRMVKSLAYHSSHALGRLIHRMYGNDDLAEVKDFTERSARGISGSVFGVEVRIGLSDFAGIGENVSADSTRIYVSIGRTVKGYFSISNEYREGIKNIAARLKKSGYTLAVMSGDHSGEKENLEEIFGAGTKILFNQSPSDKLKFIQQLQQENKNVLMIGDGLNDAGALKQSNVGISISDDVNNFSPACDGILKATSFSSLNKILSSAKASRKIILTSFVIALLYNVIGLSFAVFGNLSPVVAAILMPVSAVTIITFTTGISNVVTRKL